MRLRDNIRASAATTIGLVSGLGWVGGVVKALTPVNMSTVGKSFIGTTTALATGGATLAAMLTFPEYVRPLLDFSVMTTTALASAGVTLGTGLAYTIGGGLGTAKKAQAETKPLHLLHRPF